MAMPPRIRIVGELERADHHHLPAEAKCYFWGEYTPGAKWDYSETNQLIFNMKKKMDRRGQPGWAYKQRAIDSAAEAFAKTWKWDELAKQKPALIPMPPSKNRGDPLYDPRMLEMLLSLNKLTGVGLDIRDCLSFDGSCAASHETDQRPTIDELYRALDFDQAAGRHQEFPRAVFLFDDMLTTGAHLVAATRKLHDYFPNIPIFGMFVARRRVKNPFEDFDEM